MKGNKNREEEYLIFAMHSLLTIQGESCNEGKVLDFISSEISSHDSTIQIVRDDKGFGLYALVPSKSKNQGTIIFDSHCDTVQKEMIEPKFYEEEVDGVKRTLVNATGIDNRIHCAILLTLTRFCRYEHLSFISLFSVREEIGLKGALCFANNVDVCVLHQDFVKKIRKIVVLDVHSGKRAFESKNSNPFKTPIIGNGFCPVKQPFRTGESGNACNLRAFKVGRLYYRYPRCRYAVVCNRMHSLDKSFTSVEDTVGLFKFLKDDLEMNLRKEKYELYQKDMFGPSEVDGDDLKNLFEEESDSDEDDFLDDVETSELPENKPSLIFGDTTEMSDSSEPSDDEEKGQNELSNGEEFWEP